MCSSAFTFLKDSIEVGSETILPVGILTRTNEIVAGIGEVSTMTKTLAGVMLFFHIHNLL